MDYKEIIKNFDYLSEYPLILPMVGLGFGLMLFLVIVDALTTSFRSLSRASRLIRNRTRAFNILQSQTEALRTHATSYTNTLGIEGAKLLVELNEIVREQETILLALEDAKLNWDIEQINRIEKEPTVSNKELFVNRLKRAETIIGYLSARLVEASMTATKLHIPKIKKATSTMEGLSRVGLAVVEPGDRD